MTGLTLSFIISTKNRLPFLKILFTHILPSIQVDEEIVVVDGGSTDGAKEYLTGLHQSGKIHKFISEPDRNQANGWNKAMLMAGGKIIKKLIDDDVHNINAIRHCRDFMLKTPGADICISDMLDSSLADTKAIGKASRLPYYRQWKDGMVKSFTFSDVSMLVRRSSLSFLGLYDTQLKMIDWEYSLRVSYLKAGIAYYTGYNSLSVTTPGNVSSTASRELFKREELIGRTKYEYPGDTADISSYSKMKVWLGEIYDKITGRGNPMKGVTLPPVEELGNIYAGYYSELEKHNKVKGEFIF